MHSAIRRLAVLIATITLLTLGPAAGVAEAQENPPPTPIDLPCVSNAYAQILGRTPVNDGTHDLIQARIIFEEGGSVMTHTHPGSIISTVETGALGFIHLGDGEITVTRAATADSEATTEAAPHGEQVALASGDGFVETGMLHTAVNLAAGPTTVLVTGLIEPGQPLTICVDDGSPRPLNRGNQVLP